MLFGWYGQNGEQNRQPISRPIGSQRSSLMYQTDILGKPVGTVGSAEPGDITVAATASSPRFNSPNGLNKSEHSAEPKPGHKLAA
jgi:hypothetical protein